MFSATFPVEIQRLAAEYMRPYVYVAVGRVGSTSENISQEIILCRDSSKPVKQDMLCQVLEREQGAAFYQPTIVFVQTKANATRLTKRLNARFRGSLVCVEIHGDRSQSQREAALAAFREGKANVMIATDVAARGLDIPDIAHVINVDLPHSAEDFDSYVHRIGRTGRAGKTGKATSFFVDSMEPKHGNAKLGRPLAQLLQETGQEVPAFLQKYCSSCGGAGGGGSASGATSRVSGGGQSGSGREGGGGGGGRAGRQQQSTGDARGNANVFRFTETRKEGGVQCQSRDQQSAGGSSGPSGMGLVSVQGAYEAGSPIIGGSNFGAAGGAAEGAVRGGGGGGGGGARGGGARGGGARGRGARGGGARGGGARGGGDIRGDGGGDARGGGAQRGGGGAQGSVGGAGGAQGGVGGVGGDAPRLRMPTGADFVADKKRAAAPRNAAGDAPATKTARSDSDGEKRRDGGGGDRGDGGGGGGGGRPRGERRRRGGRGGGGGSGARNGL